MNIERPDIIKRLAHWKSGSDRKPLVLMGARQVGKTYSIKSFAKAHYDNYVYLNFEDQPVLSRLFDSGLDPKTILKALTIEFNQDITADRSLIIFDEVQQCPNALTSLKYFNERANDYHICAAGSLLGVKLLNTSGFPVGKVNFLDLFPLSFQEFLGAINERRISDYLLEIEDIAPIPENLHVKLMQRFKEYLFVGGMPEVVAKYATTEKITDCRRIHDEILRTYALDFAKHAPENIIMKINQVWDSIPSQLAKENKKFVYSIIRKGARAKEYEDAIQWLNEAGLIHKTYNISKPSLPLNAYAKIDYFKTYCVDVGLLGAKSNLSANTILYDNQLFQEFKGALIENYVAQELARQHERLYYWTSENTAELDFLIQHKDLIYPLEVKSGTSKKKKSLKVYSDTYKPKLQLRCSTMNLKIDGNLLNIPLYMLSEISRLIDKHNM